MSPSLASALTVAACVICVDHSALANGRYPSAGQIAEDPADPQHWLARTTYGFLQSVDARQSWQWICEASVGYDGQEDPFVGITANGSIVATTTQGLSVSQDRGCTWRKAAAPEWLGRLPAVDLAVDPRQPSRVVVLATAQDQAKHQLFESLDNGASWHSLGQPLPDGAHGLTLEIAPSLPSRIYVSARAGADFETHLLLRTDDGGATWLERPFALPALDARGAPLPADQTQVLGTYIGAVDPLAPDTVWLRVLRFQPDQLWRTMDGGLTWQRVFEAKQGKLVSFALSPDGTQVAVGGTGADPGVWRSATATLGWSRAGPIGASCLKWTATGLFACADETTDGMTIGQSTDGGAHFSPVHHRSDLTQLQCPTGTRTALLCPKVWPLTAYNLGLDTAPPAAAATPAPRGCSAGLPTTTAGIGGWILLACLAVLSMGSRRLPW